MEDKEYDKYCACDGECFASCERTRDERDTQILSWLKIPIWPEEEGKLGRIVCPTCGDSLIRIRGPFPNTPPRDVCATCAIETMEMIKGNLYPNNQATSSSS